VRVIAFVAAASVAFGSTVTMAQIACPANAVYRDSVCICADGFSLVSGSCISSALIAEEPQAPTGGETTASVESGGHANLPVLGSMPAGAVIVGGLVMLAGIAIGVAAASGGS